MNRWPKPIDHTYILCDPAREPERAAYLTNWLSTNNVDPATYTMFLECYGTNLSHARAHSVYNPYQDRSPIEAQRNWNSYNLKTGEISLVLNWAAASQRAVDAGHEVVMILESDVLFSTQFLEKLTDSMDAIRTKMWDFLSISAGADLRPPRPANYTTEPCWFRAPYYYHTRTTDAMIIKVSMLKKILSTLFPFAEVLDWELNYQLSLHNSVSYWLDPAIIRQGSGKEYPSTL